MSQDTPAKQNPAETPDAGTPETPSQNSPSPESPSIQASSSETVAAEDPPSPEPDAGTPAAGTPAAGTPDAGTPAAGTPESTQSESAESSEKPDVVSEESTDEDVSETQKEPSSTAETPEPEEQPQEPVEDPISAEQQRDLHESAHFEKVMDFDKVRALLSDFCSCSLGRRVVERMKVLTEAQAIRTCLEQTQEMRNLKAHHGRLPLAGITDASGLIRRALEATRPLTGKELIKIQGTLETGAEFLALLKDQDQHYPRLCSLVQHMDPLEHISKKIRKVIWGNGKVRDDATPKLYDLRRKIESLRSKVENKIQALARQNDISRILQNPHPTQRNGRHVLAVKAEQRRLIPGILHDRSKTGSTVFIEPESIVAMGNELQDVVYDESAEITRILWTTTRTVVDHFDAIERNTRTLAWIDFTHAKASMADNYKLTVPDHSEHQVELREVKHLLLLDQANKRQQAGEPAMDVVPSTVHLGQDFDMLILTGPNTGGKTVLLKSVGLCALMHQCGLPVPAATGAKLPVFKRFYADIGDEQSIQQNLSTFSAHITRMKDFLDGACPDTLILIDELGAGTDPQEGAALGRALLDEFLSRSSLSIVTTHLGSLKDFAFQRTRAENGAMSFDTETLSPTYQFFIGQPGTSNALDIAQRLKIPESILKSAKSLLAGEDTSSNDLINEIQKVRLQNEATRQRLLDNEAKLKDELAAAGRERDEAKQLKTALSKEANLEMTERFKSLKDLFNAATEDLKGERKVVLERLKQLRKDLNELLYHTPYEEKRRRFASLLKRGDEVYVISFEKIAKIERINKERKEITVMINSLPIKTHFDNVSWIEGAQNRAAARFEMAQTERSGKNWREHREREQAYQRQRQQPRGNRQQERREGSDKNERSQGSNRRRRRGGRSKNRSGQRSGRQPRNRGGESS